MCHCFFKILRVLGKNDFMFLSDHFLLLPEVRRFYVTEGMEEFALFELLKGKNI